MLPYASVNERRDRWRKDFHDRFRPLIRGARTPGEAAVLLNQKVFSLVKVHYSTKRPKPDQSPSESIDAGMASCTGLSILLIDACRSVGVPARFVGTFWTDNSGNHSWAEVWDRGWHYTGADEPAGGKLDQGWFGGKAATARSDDPWHAIYAVSYRRTPLRFPVFWSPGVDYIHAVNVTDRYKNQGPKTPAGTIPVMFRVLETPGGDRCAASLRVLDAAGKTVFEGTTKDERFDANDHLTTFLPPGQEYRVDIRRAGRAMKAEFRSERRDTPYTWCLKKAGQE